MVITSIYFVLFTVLALSPYYMMPRRWQNVWLLLISYIFISSWDWRFAFLLGALTLTNYVIARGLRVDNRGRPGMLWIGIGINLLVLIYFRVADFFLPGLETLLNRIGVQTQAGGLQVLLPLGLSFYVLQAISYLVDVYRGQQEAEKNFLDLALYFAYFPKIIAGPIERARSFLPKLTQARVVDNSVISRSIMLIFVGVVRKLLIADTLNAFFLQDVFELPAKYTPVELFLWMTIYAFVLYNDFAGYTDIIRGVSGFFGIELTANFRTPYFSRSFTEFWTRWHITLSEWLRDYIYFPLSRILSRRYPNRRNLLNLVLPPMVTMLVSGLWHGFNWYMLLWGFMHGMYLIIERVSNLWRPAEPSQNQPRWRQGLAMVVVFIFVTLAWVPFRWGLPAAFDVWNALLNWSHFGIGYQRMLVALPILVGALFLDYLQYHAKDEFVYLKWPRLVKAACMAGILLLIFVVTGGDFQEPFVYQAF